MDPMVYVSDDRIDHIYPIEKDLDISVYQPAAFSLEKMQFEPSLVHVKQRGFEQLYYNAVYMLLEDPRNAAVCVTDPSTHPWNYFSREFFDVISLFHRVVFLNEEVKLERFYEDEYISSMDPVIEFAANARKILSDFHQIMLARLYGPINKRRSNGRLYRVIQNTSLHEAVNKEQNIIYLYKDEKENILKGRHPHGVTYNQRLSRQNPENFLSENFFTMPVERGEDTDWYLVFIHQENSQVFIAYRLASGTDYLQLAFSAGLVGDTINPENAMEIFQELESRKVSWKEIVKELQDNRKEDKLDEE